MLQGICGIKTTLIMGPELETGDDQPGGGDVPARRRLLQHPGG